MPAISATKSLSGHSQGAAGVHEAIYTLLMMQAASSAKAPISTNSIPVGDANIVRKRIDNAKHHVASCRTASALAAPMPRWSSSALKSDVPEWNKKPRGITSWLKPNRD
jgi:hypothetical protein